MVRTMKEKKRTTSKKTVLAWIIIIALFIFIGSSVNQIIKHVKKAVIRRQIDNQTYVEKNLVSVELPDCTIYLDKRLKYYESLCLALDLDWIYKCKLYKDFGWYPDSYLVFTSIDFIRKDDLPGFNTNAYFMYNNKNDDKFIFIWNTADSSIIHELAHFADYTHGQVSHNHEWKEIYEAEWKKNKWLKQYYDDSFNESEQLEKLLEESFAEGFSQWYCRYYSINYSNQHPEVQNDDLIFHTVTPQSIDVNELTYPLTFSYMNDFYANYKFNDYLIEAAELGYTSID